MKDNMLTDNNFAEAELYFAGDGEDVVISEIDDEEPESKLMRLAEAAGMLNNDDFAEVLGQGNLLQQQQNVPLREEAAPQQAPSQEEAPQQAQEEEPAPSRAASPPTEAKVFAALDILFVNREGKPPTEGKQLKLFIVMPFFLAEIAY